MPVFSRAAFRQRVGFDHLHDIEGVWPNTAATVAANTAGFAVMNQAAAHLALSGAGAFEGAWFYVGGNDYAIASYNVGSGAFWTNQVALAVVPTGTVFEVHTAIRVRDKHFAINEAIRRLRPRQEVALAGVTGQIHYDLDGTASPNTIANVLDVYWLESPGVTTAQRRQRLAAWQAVQTASGHELRIDPAVPSGAALIVDAAVEVSLGVADEATINVPALRWVTVGAAAQALWQMEQRTGPEGVVYRTRRAELEAEFKRLTAQYGAYGWNQGRNPDADDGPPVAPGPATHEAF